MYFSISIATSDCEDPSITVEYSLCHSDSIDVKYMLKIELMNQNSNGAYPSFSLFYDNTRYNCENNAYYHNTSMLIESPTWNCTHMGAVLYLPEWSWDDIHEQSSVMKVKVYLHNREKPCKEQEINFKACKCMDIVIVQYK